MSPVRGHGWYKRPYRLHYEWKGRAYNKAYHWPKGWSDDIDWLRRNRIPFKSWVVRDEKGRVADIEPRGLLW